MDEERGFAGWLLLFPAMVPREWQHRAIEVAFIPLFPAEASQILAERGTVSRVDETDLPIVRLVARGKSATEIARELGIAPRTVYRRVARLRQEFAVASTAELAAALAKQGF